MPRNPIVITGASSGIGKAAALELAELGEPLVLVCREGAKARDAHAEIIRRSGNKAVELVTADLSSQSEIHLAAQVIADRHKAIHGLVNNAGISPHRRQLSSEGIEMTFAVNVFAPFLLTSLLVEPLRADGEAHVVNVASDLLRKVQLDDLDRAGRFDAFEVYGQSKLADLMLTIGQAERLKPLGIAVNALAPGFLRTALARDARGLSRLFFALASRTMMQSARKGGHRIAQAVRDPALTGTTGQFIVKNRVALRPALASDGPARSALWVAAEQATGAIYPALEAADPA
ncbi:MAG: family oxidoreductase [Hyphomicrobiales bacterium]|nr:family oxidoreductase [Hyphomicrobiales bacterium]